MFQTENVYCDLGDEIAFNSDPDSDDAQSHIYSGTIVQKDNNTMQINIRLEKDNQIHSYFIDEIEIINVVNANVKDNNHTIEINNPIDESKELIYTQQNYTISQQPTKKNISHQRSQSQLVNVTHSKPSHKRYLSMSQTEIIKNEACDTEKKKIIRTPTRALPPLPVPSKKHLQNTEQKSNVNITAEHKGCDKEFIENCLCVQRMKELMILYDKYKNDMQKTSFMDIINDNLNFTYDITDILNDYIHIIVTHDDKLEDIYDIMQVKCDLNNCMSMVRNQRDRSKRNDKHYQFTDLSSDRNNRVAVDIIDQIHSYLIHTFHAGYKLTNDEQKSVKIGKPIKWRDKNEEEIENETHLEFKNIQKILNDKRDKFSRIFKRMNYSKFVTDSDDIQNNNELKQNIDDNVQQHMVYINHNNEKKVPTYSLSYRFNYWGRGKLYEQGPEITAKYSSFKDELLTNKICNLELNEWDDVTDKAKRYLVVDFAKKFEARYNNYGIERKQPISLNHIIAIILYTDFDYISYKFSETFRHLHQTETVKELIERHCNYYWFGKILRETVEIYGKYYSPYITDQNRYFHGISCLMQFTSTVASFNHPMSTTKQLSVAQRFATSNGIIIQIGPHLSATLVFECSWISAYPSEDETLFIGGLRPIKIENIINCCNGKSYKRYFSALEQLIKCIHGKKPENATKKDRKCLELLFSDKAKEFVDPYFLDIFKGFGNSIKNIYIDLQELRDYKWILSLLCTTIEVKKAFINMKNIAKVFKNIQSIKMEYKGTYYRKIALSPSYMNVVRNSLNENNILSLKEITIANVKLDEKDVDNKQFESVTELLKTITLNNKWEFMFADEFKNEKWKEWASGAITLSITRG